MRSNEPSSCVKVAACICGEDGVISEAELQKLFEILTEKFPEFGAEVFESSSFYSPAFRAQCCR